MERITISLSEDIGEELRKLARKRRESVSKVASKVIVQYFDSVRHKKPGRRVLTIINDSEISVNSKIRSETNF